MRVWKEKSGVNSTIALAEDLGLVHQAPYSHLYLQLLVAANPGKGGVPSSCLYDHCMHVAHIHTFSCAHTEHEYIFYKRDEIKLKNTATGENGWESTSPLCSVQGVLLQNMWGDLP